MPVKTQHLAAGAARPPARRAQSGAHRRRQQRAQPAAPAGRQPIKRPSARLTNLLPRAKAGAIVGRAGPTSGRGLGLAAPPFRAGARPHPIASSVSRTRPEPAQQRPELVSQWRPRASCIWPLGCSRQLSLAENIRIHARPGLVRPGQVRSMDQQDEMRRLRAASKASAWHWSESDKSGQCLISDDKLTVCIHPNCSESTAACRGSRPFPRDGNYHYWELQVLDKTYGTSIMFGLCTQDQPLHALDYCNLVGLDHQGWSLNHTGLAWHRGQSRQYTRKFPINQPVKIGLLLNTARGELSYFMNGHNLGVAFRGLNDTQADLYPVVASTTRRTRISIVGTYCGYNSLLERTCYTIVRRSRNTDHLVDYLKHYGMPAHLLDYLKQAQRACESQTAIVTSTETGGDRRPDDTNTTQC